MLTYAMRQKVAALDRAEERERVERAAVAVHEGAHVVLGAMAGVRTLHAWITPDPWKLGAARFAPGHLDGVTDEELFLVYAAGRAAEWKYLDSKGSVGYMIARSFGGPRTLAGTDADAAEVALDVIAPDGSAERDAARETLWRATEEAVAGAGVWREITAVADALVASPTGSLNSVEMANLGLGRPKTRGESGPALTFAPVLCDATRGLLERHRQHLARTEPPAYGVRASLAGYGSTDPDVIAEELGLPADSPVVQLAAMSRAAGRFAGRRQGAR